MRWVLPAGLKTFVTTMIISVLLAVSAAVPESAAGPVAPSSLSALPSGCGQLLAFKSVAANRYVSAELDYSGGGWAMLRARATSIGPWEQFSLCGQGNQTALWSVAAGNYVSMEYGYGGGAWAMLRARSATHDAWEHFSLEHIGSCGDSCTAIRSTFTDRLVTAELAYEDGDYGMLRARTTGTPEAWEQFVIELLPVSGGGR
jgi:hypothetical protein